MKNVVNRALVAPFIVPLLTVGGVYRLYRKIRYQKRPKPIPKNIRRFIKPDRVLDENKWQGGCNCLPEVNSKCTKRPEVDDVTKQKLRGAGGLWSGQVPGVYKRMVIGEGCKDRGRSASH